MTLATKRGGTKVAPTPASRAREVAGVSVKPIVQPVPRPAYAVSSGGLPPIHLGDLGEAVAVTAAGAVVTAAFITALQGGVKWIGAGISAGIGVLFVSTSPMGTLSSELGIGMLSSAAGWFWFDVLGKIKG